MSHGTEKWSANDMRKFQKGIAMLFIVDKKILVMDHVKVGKWLIPTGGVDEGDSIDKTFRKEMSEELGIDVTEYKVIGKCTKKYIRNNREVTVENTYGICTGYVGEIINNEPHKHKSLKWVTAAESKGMLLGNVTEWAINYAVSKGIM